MDVDTSRRRWRIHVREAKTSAGERDVPVSGYLQPIIAGHLARRRAEGAKPRDPPFATSRGGFISQDNWRARQWAKVIQRANRLCAEHGDPPISGIDLLAADGKQVVEAPDDEARATPHALRRSYITHMARLGTHPKQLMRWVGHKDAKVTIQVYERVEESDDDLEPLDVRDPWLRVLYGDGEPPVGGLAA